jgi:tRNA (adenine22-N1)-methyltransferase
VDARNDPSREGKAVAGRLATVAALVPPGVRVADVGTGHGRLPRRLLDSGRTPHCVATERTPRLLRGVRGYPSGHPLADRLELRAGDGLAALRNEDRVEVVVIAGLGGSSILGILERSPLPCTGFSRLVLQPQTEQAELRRRLIEGGWAVVAERLAFERRRFYLVLAAEPQAGAPLPSWPGLDSDDLLAAGPCLLRDRDPLLAPYWQRQAARLERIVKRARGEGRESARRGLETAKRILRAAGRPPPQVE